MKIRTILIIIVLVLIAVFGAWIIFGGGSAPYVERVRDGLPFGSSEGVNIPALPEDSAGESAKFDTDTSSDSKLLRLVNTPVAGFVTLSRGTTTVVRYADRATGHISDVMVPTLERTRVTNNTLPKIYEAHFRSDGLVVIFRSLENDSDAVENLSLTLTPPRGTSTDLYGVSITNLRGRMDSVVSGIGNILYYVLKDSSSIVSSTFTGTDLRTVFSSKFDNWRLGRLGNNLLIYTKASADAPGYAYNLSLGGSLTKIVGQLNGLATIANGSGNRILYSYNDAGRTRLFARNLQSGIESEILPASLAEKCVWSPKETSVFFCGTPLAEIVGKEPDSWYAGRSHFSDYIWSFNAESEIAQLIVNPKSDFGLDLDVSSPQVSSDGNYLIFINRNDLTLWAVKLQ